MRYIIFILLISLACISCTNRKEYDNTVADGIKKIPVIIETYETFDIPIKSSISYYSKKYGSPVWTTTVLLYDRYILRIDIDVDFEKGKIISFKNPSYYLYEITSIIMQSNGGVNISSNGGISYHLTNEEWKTLIFNNGDFPKIKIELKKDQPITEIRTAFSEL